MFRLLCPELQCILRGIKKVCLTLWARSTCYLQCTPRKEYQFTPIIFAWLSWRFINGFLRLCKRKGTTNTWRSTTTSSYRAVLLYTVCYSSELWVTYRHRLHLKAFQKPSFVTIIYIIWSDFHINTEVLEKAKIVSIEAMLLNSQLRWAGHISRIGNHRLLRIVPYSELSAGYRDRKVIQGQLEIILSYCYIDYHRGSTIS